MFMYKDQWSLVLFREFGLKSFQIVRTLAFERRISQELGELPVELKISERVT